VKVRIRRSYLVRMVETWEYDAREPFNLPHVLSDHFGEFDDDLTAHGTLLTSEHEYIDHDDLSLQPLGAENNVIPLRKKGKP
jgi:hypothetical protein